MEWWVTKGNQVPVGPVTTELLLRGISAGAVPRDAMICEVGGSQWRWIGEMAPFSIALTESRMRRSLDSGDDVTITDPPMTGDTLSEFAEDQTTQTTIELPRRWFESLNDSEERTEERTIVDLYPLRPSEPPTDV
jgi:hypothetical protein